MIRTIAALIASMVAGCAAVEADVATGPAPYLATDEAFVFEEGNGEGDSERVDAFRGSFSVPENRSDPDSRSIDIHYVRFPATTDTPGAPIIYLAGGPGGSGIATAKFRRFALFMAMREFGDVIALDQRGTGASDDMPECKSSIQIPQDKMLSDAKFNALHQQAAVECAKFWKENGIDLYGYTTRESVSDLDALRQHLGAEKIALWGISYGSHLAFAAMNDIEDRIDRVVIASAEGLDQTVKLPARTDAYFDRLQLALNTNPQMAAMMPDIKAMMGAVQESLEQNPVTVAVPLRDGSEEQILIDKRLMQTISSALIADPENAVQLMWLYGAASQGNYDHIGQLLGRFIVPSDPIKFRAMPLAMDIASGVSDERMALFNAQAPDGIVGAMLNFPMPQLNGVIPGLDLGPEFRRGPDSEIPTLLLTGTLDGRTYPEGQREATAGLSNLTQVTVVNAGHNLFMKSPKVTEAIRSFMRGEEVRETTITIDLPSMTPPGGAP